MDTHKQTNELLVAFVLGELPVEKSSAVKAHLAECNHCARELKRLEAVLQSSENMSSLSADERLCESAKDRIFAAVSSQEKLKTIAWPNVGRVFGRRIIMTTSIAKIGIAAVVAVAMGLFGLLKLERAPSEKENVFSRFGLLAKACAAEEAFFVAKGIAHVKNEIIVYPGVKEQNASGQPGESPDYTWLPMCSLKADGRLGMDQLKLSVGTQTYAVIDESWHDSLTGYFVRLLKTSQKPIFANSYDGQFVYTASVGPDGTLQAVKEAVTRRFKLPRSAAEFLGIAIGLKSSLAKDGPTVQSVEQGTLSDGKAAHIYKVGTEDPNGELKSYWLFKVRDDDTTIAEKEFVLYGRPQLLIRRVLTESVKAPAIGWNLSEISGLNVTTEQSQVVSVTPDMVILNVTVQRMVKHAKFETYIFSAKPCWTSDVEITDFLDLGSLPRRAFILACRADDGRHVVLVQSPTYNKMLGARVKEGKLVYTAPNGFKVWGGGPEKWYSKILLQGAQASIKDPPADDRIGYVLESPAGTFPALAINGPVTDQELRSLIDSLIPAKEYLKSQVVESQKQ